MNWLKLDWIGLYWLGLNWEGNSLLGGLLLLRVLLLLFARNHLYSHYCKPTSWEQVIYGDETSHFKEFKWGGEYFCFHSKDSTFSFPLNSGDSPGKCIKLSFKFHFLLTPTTCEHTAGWKIWLPEENYWLAHIDWLCNYTMPAGSGPSSRGDKSHLRGQLGAHFFLLVYCCCCCYKWLIPAKQSWLELDCASRTCHLLQLWASEWVSHLSGWYFGNLFFA